MNITTRPKIRPPPDTANPNHNTRIGPKITIFVLLIIPLSLIGLFPDAQAQATPTITGDPFTIGEGNSTLSVYSSGGIIGNDNSILQRNIFGVDNFNVDSSERLVMSWDISGNLQHFLFDLDTTLGELQQTIGSGNVLPTGSGVFNYNVTSLTDTNGITNIYLAVFDDDVVINNLVGNGTAVPLIENATSERSVTIHLDTVPVSPSYDLLYNSTLADKNIGYILEFSNPITINSGEQYPISLDFSLFDADGVAINHINRQPSQPDPPSFADSSLPDITLEATGPLTDIRPALDANVPAATASDGTPVIPTHNASASYPLGTHTITWNATSDGLSAAINQNVTVRDTTAPTFDVTSLDDLSIPQNGTQTDIRPTLNANVPAATDIVDQSVDVTHNANAAYGIGNYTITWTATDDQGLTDTITQRVIVTDTQPPLTPAQETTRQNLVNAIAARQAAIDQQNVIVNYWSDSNNPFADDRELAQARIDYANSHIMQSTQQRDSYQAQLDQILNP